MTPRVLFIVTSDPRNSARPAEAIRIAAGVGVWKKTEVSVYLRGPAILALSDSTEELVDEENFRLYLPMLDDPARPIYVEKGAGALAGQEDLTLPVAEISDAELGELLQSQSYTMRF